MHLCAARQGSGSKGKNRAARCAPREHQLGTADHDMHSGG